MVQGNNIGPQQLYTFLFQKGGSFLFYHTKIDHGTHIVIEFWIADVWMSYENAFIMHYTHKHTKTQTHTHNDWVFNPWGANELS